jgi:hypothetical protein
MVAHYDKVFLELLTLEKDEQKICDAVDLCLKLGMPVDQQVDNRTLLVQAVSMRHFQVALYLIGNGANVKSMYNQQTTLLDLAYIAKWEIINQILKPENYDDIMTKAHELIFTLKEKGVSRLRGAEGIQDLFLETCTKGHLEYLKNVIMRAEAFDIPIDDFFKQGVKMAVTNGHYEVVEYLTTLKNCVSVDLLEIPQNNVKIIELLLQNGLSMNDVSPDRRVELSKLLQCKGKEKDTIVEVTNDKVNNEPYKVLSYTVEFSDGAIFVGSMKDEKPYQGTLTLTDGVSMKGTFVDEQFVKE